MRRDRDPGMELKAPGGPRAQGLLQRVGREVFKDVVYGVAIVDTWAEVENDTPVTDSIDVILPLSRVLAGERGLGRTGVRIESPEDLDALVARGFDGLDLISVHFKLSKDGRGYSLARLLRDRHGWRGELRATGDIKRDQLFYLKRVGFNTFRLKAGQDPVGAAKAFRDFSRVYQGASDGLAPIYRNEVPNA